MEHLEVTADNVSRYTATVRDAQSTEEEDISAIRQGRQWQGQIGTAVGITKREGKGPENNHQAGLATARWVRSAWTGTRKRAKRNIGNVEHLRRGLCITAFQHGDSHFLLLPVGSEPSIPRLVRTESLFIFGHKKKPLPCTHAYMVQEVTSSIWAWATESLSTLRSPPTTLWLAVCAESTMPP